MHPAVSEPKSALDFIKEGKERNVTLISPKY